MKQEERMNGTPLLSVQDFSVSFRMYAKGLHQVEHEAVHHISLDVHPGEILAVIGSSGSGKSLLAHGILGILPNNSVVTGQMTFAGQTLDEQTLAKLRGSDIAFVPQSISHLNPLVKVEELVFGTVDKEVHWPLFQEFGFQKGDMDKYPFQLSGGMARRILIMTAAISKGSLVIADEPTPGLSPQLARETLQRFRKMADEGKGVLIITHDIDLICEVADRIAIFYQGSILETTTVENFTQGGTRLNHPYSRALWEALPQHRFDSLSLEEIKAQCDAEGYYFPDVQKKGGH